MRREVEPLIAYWGNGYIRSASSGSCRARFWSGVLECIRRCNAIGRLAKSAGGICGKLDESHLGKRGGLSEQDEGILLEHGCAVALDFAFRRLRNWDRAYFF